ncbi:MULTISPECIES: glycosyltransferase family 4 protein [Halorhodospira]|uniref:glycosyltransferase family 4 protein n=1 Tax=Halorhodospira TaxID=85108 RepID=UPI001EE8B86D|nr:MULTISPECIES: glycosyltransferase family 4 protein [Halorhodospira]MCG5529230.1 glycosyltransferase family 4 protein [Halorhodospira halophila]MCG5544584.1 glycosyltransferase family 4 protein [Halorhodospira sp. 9628]
MRIVVIGSLARSLINFRGPMLRELRARGHQVIACAPDAQQDVREELQRLDVDYHDIPLSRAGMNPTQDLRTLKYLRRFFLETQPDAVLAYTIKPVIWGLLAARFAGVPQRYAMITGLGYAFLQGDGVRQRLIQSLVTKLYRSSLKGATGIFFQNPDDQTEFQERSLISSETSIHRIHGSGVDLKYFSPSPLPKNNATFLLIARLLGDKGIREYQQAARDLKKRYPGTRFLLAGPLDNNPSAISEEELGEWKESGDLEYLGPLSDVRGALSTCTVYVLPSYREGTPRTVLEAMATGRAIITTDAPGCRETVEPGVNGVLVPPRDTAALAEAMETFIHEPERAERMGRESLRLARERYAVEKVNATILSGMGLSTPQGHD